MKNSCLLILILYLAACQPSREPDLQVIITPEQYSETPISQLLYSHFIEIGFGYQIAPMQAQQFFNRSFEDFPPYNGKSKNSFGLLVGDGDYIKDWSGEAWYHSGYEHNAWYAAPGKSNNPSWITDTSTYFIQHSDQASVRITQVPGGVHGNKYLKIKNEDPVKWAGLAQEGKWLEENKAYKFSGYLKWDSLEDIPENESVKLCLFSEGNFNDTLFTSVIRINMDFKKYEVDIPYTGPSHKVTFALLIPPGSEISADAFSLLPEDHYFWWKPETIEAIKQLNPGLIRFPGGCFASFYDWKQGIGSHDTRVPEPSYFWGGLNNNDLGTNEFAMMCQEVGCEMMLCINMFHPGKVDYLKDSRNPWQDTDYHLPQFGDIEKGIESACDWLAYCNLPAGKHPMADLRAKNGFPEPFHVVYWEMDNETVRWMSPQEYAHLVVRYSEAMKALDPDIRIGMVTYDFTDHVPEMLEIAGEHIDFFADRDDFEDGRLDHMIALLENYNAAHQTDIRYCNTEWQVHPYGAPNPVEQVPDRFLYGHQTKIKRSMVLGTWYCGLKAAGYLMDWQRKGHIVDFVNYNNFSNTHGQAVIETPKEGAYLTAPGRLYELISRTPARYILKIADYKPNRNDQLQAQAAWDADRSQGILFALNKSDSIQTISFDLNRLDRKFDRYEMNLLHADHLMARTKLDAPTAIHQTTKTGRIRKMRLSIEVPPRSFTEILLE